MSGSETIQSHVRIATGLSLAIASVCVILRYVARRLLRQSLFLDDFLIFAALVFLWGIGIAGLILVRNGLGIHVNHVSADNLVTYMMVLYAGAPLYALTIVSIKLSLLFLYHRLFPTKYMTYSCLVVGTLVVAWGIATTVTGLFLCNPVRKLWSPNIPGQCLDLGQFYYGIQIPNIITDIAILVLPIKAICRLPISGREKVSLSAIFGLGVVVIIFDIIRFTVMVALARSGPDITWNQVATSVWTSIEPAAAISIACLVHLRPVFRWLKLYWKPETHARSSSALADGSNETYTGSTASIFNGDQSNDINEKGSIGNNVDFTATRLTSIDSDAEAGLVKHPLRIASYSATSSGYDHASLGCEVATFPAIVESTTPIQPSRTTTIYSMSESISPIDEGPGPAVKSMESPATLVTLKVEAEKESSNTESSESLQLGDQTVQVIEPELTPGPDFSRPVALCEKPLPLPPPTEVLEGSSQT